MHGTMNVKRLSILRCARLCSQNARGTVQAPAATLKEVLRRPLDTNEDLVARR